MHRYRLFLLVLVCSAMLILCVPCAASSHGPAPGSEYGGSDAAGAAGPASSGPSGSGPSPPTSGSNTPGAGPAVDTTPEKDADGGTESGISHRGEISEDAGGAWYGQDFSGPSAETAWGPGSPPDSGGSGDDHAPLQGAGEPPGPARKTQAGVPEEDPPGFAGPGPGEGADAPGTAQRMSRDGGIGPSAGIVVMGVSGGMTRGADAVQGFIVGEGGAGAPAREGGHNLPRDPPRDTPHKSVPPETPARIEQENSGSPARSKGKREDEPEGIEESCSRRSDTAGSFPEKELFFFFSLFGFRRIRKKNVLDNECRKAVFQAIADAPGMDAVSLSRRLEMNINTLRYHLTKLLATDKITYLARPGTVRYYLNQGMFSPYEQILIHYLGGGTAGCIIRLVSEHPGVSRKDLAQVLGISGPSVTRHIQELSAEGIIRNEPDGKAHHYYLTENAALLLTKLQVMPSGSPARTSPAPV